MNVNHKQHIIGYVTYHYPDPLERWSSGKLPYLIELGAIEISLPYRYLHLGTELIKLSLLDDLLSLDHQLQKLQGPHIPLIFALIFYIHKRLVQSFLSPNANNIQLL